MIFGGSLLLIPDWVYGLIVIGVVIYSVIYSFKKIRGAKRLGKENKLLSNVFALAFAIVTGWALTITSGGPSGSIIIIAIIVFLALRQIF